ncbi:MAG: ATP-binding cassette domain-containing protein [Polyangiaceae bacterium]|nr:ATP-binding cassette domain-containing protein [Polyangiaceae bacterium]MCW5789727.1 ATP-binding cassette domain-containing protein [Polyangiaceae bacterium]
MPPVLLRAAQVTRRYGDRVVLAGVDLELAEGELVVLLGRSGAGKTSLLRLFARLEEPDEGALFFDGAPLTSHDPRALRRQVAYVAQAPVVFPGTLRDNLTMVPRGIIAPSEAQLVAQLEAVGLAPERLDRDASRLSGGERQRLCLVRALLMEPRVLLLDEPTSALDPAHEQQLTALIRERVARGGAALVITHSERVARLLAGRVALLADGRLTPLDAEAQRAFFHEEAP